MSALLNIIYAVNHMMINTKQILTIPVLVTSNVRFDICTVTSNSVIVNDGRINVASGNIITIYGIFTNNLIELDNKLPLHQNTCVTLSLMSSNEKNMKGAFY